MIIQLTIIIYYITHHNLYIIVHHSIIHINIFYKMYDNILVYNNIIHIVIN